jgi:hypothetical protein
MRALYGIHPQNVEMCINNGIAVTRIPLSTAYRQTA